VTAGAPEQFGPYVVFEELGVGGMASVHRAETHGLEGFSRPVALKRMLPHCAVSSDFVQSFVREARIASHLRHINVAQTYELGKVDGIYFIAMELVAGKNLRQVLRHCAQMTGPMPVAITLNILNQICDALDYAHNLCDESGQPLGIIHRDVSPSNIIVSAEGVVKLIDFGIAKASAAGMQTTSGLLKGKFGYMAPEYIAGSIDARADLFAVGVIAHELLTNRPLFTGNDDMETLQRVRGMAIKPPSARNPKVPPEIDDIVMTALARDPVNRWQHATALRNAMTGLTRRLKLACSNSDVSEWLEWAFRQSRPVAHRPDDETTTDGRGDAADTAVASPVNDHRKTVRRDSVDGSHAPREERRTEPTAPQRPGARASNPAINPSYANGSSPAARLRESAVETSDLPTLPTMRTSDPDLVRSASGSLHGVPVPKVLLAKPSPNPAVARVPPMPSQPPAMPSQPPVVSLPHNAMTLLSVSPPSGRSTPAHGASSLPAAIPLPPPRAASAPNIVLPPPSRPATAARKGNGGLVLATVVVLIVAAAVTYCVLALS
jgi:serine/threonine protein kinase